MAQQKRQPRLLRETATQRREPPLQRQLEDTPPTQDEVDAETTAQTGNVNENINQPNVNEDINQPQAGREENAKVDDTSTEGAVISEAGKIDYAALPNAPKDSIVLGPGEPVRVEGDELDNQIKLTKGVYRAVLPYRSKRWTFSLIYPQGYLIPTAVAKKLNEAPVAPEDEALHSI